MVEKLGAFLEMGGHAGYVWPAYGIAAVILIGLLVVSLQGTRARETALKAVRDAMPHRAARRRGGDR